MAEAKWREVGPVGPFTVKPLQEALVDGTPIAISHHADGTFGAVSGVCNHAGGPLGEGHLDGDYIVCPWHHSAFRLPDGAVRHGPATSRQVAYRARISEGSQ